MRDFLTANYAIRTEDKLTLDGREGYIQDNTVYFIMYADNREMIHMEQAVLSYYLMEQQYDHMAVPIPNRQGQWYTEYQDKTFTVLQVRALKGESQLSPGALLANFHQTGAAYSYEPRAVSSYGAWHSLWIDKLTLFEETIEKSAADHPSSYYRLLMDSMPYIIGISENAIQYVQETENERRFHEGDQGTIAFRRYANQLGSPVLWPADLVYDHPARDVAEAMRWMLLEDEGEGTLAAFAEQYQTVRPLSVFSWRLIYARLLFPIHLFDLLERGFSTDDTAPLERELQVLLEKQDAYEKRLRHFYQHSGLGEEARDLPVLHWL
ncbi:hypothetical protein [Lentibacillus sediminis]|uniref:hypothetical protein n=1 Tax=Lentibacillus sediminis TaxID=1940529 RepID=UPI000C1C4A9B|nr:hypothetical protein [Lentibacillus sediminis]